MQTVQALDWVKWMSYSKDAKFSAFFSLEEMDIFPTVYPLHYRLHTTLKCSLSTKQALCTTFPRACWQERVHVNLFHVSYWARVLNRTLLLAAPGQRLLRWSKSSTWTAEHEKQLWLAFHVGAYSFIHRAQTCEHHCDNYLFQLHLNPKH